MTFVWAFLAFLLSAFLTACLLLVTGVTTGKSVSDGHWLTRTLWLTLAIVSSCLAVATGCAIILWPLYIVVGPLLFT